VPKARALLPHLRLARCSKGLSLINNSSPTAAPSGRERSRSVYSISVCGDAHTITN